MVSIVASRDRFPDAIAALNSSGCDGVLMIPDARVYDSPTVQRLLLWGARQKKAVWAFSANVVRAGALAGHFPDSEAVGRQAGELVGQIISGAEPAELGLQYPRQLGRAVNLNTARTIGVPMDKRRIATTVKCYGDER